LGTDFDDDVSDIIMQIYDAAIDPSQWPKILLRMAHFVGARGATVFELDALMGAETLTRALASENYLPERNEYYFKHHRDAELADQVIFARHSMNTDGIELIPCSVLAPSREELLKKPHVQTLLEVEVGYRAGALLNKDIKSIDRFAFQFSEAHGPIDQLGHERSKIILPHVAKALNVSRPIRELESLKKTLVEGLDLLAIGVCIVDHFSNVIIANQEFKRQVFEYDAFKMGRDGILGFDPDCAPGLSKLLEASFENHGNFGARPRKEAIVYKSKSGPDHLSVDIVPLVNADELSMRGQKSSILISLDTQLKHDFDAARVGQAFDLTKAEQEVLELVAEGYSNQEISDRLNKAKSTTDTQLKSILAKAMVKNRTQLVRIASQTKSFVIDD